MRPEIMTTNSITTSTQCPECIGELSLDSVEQGEILVCEDCGVELEVRALDPLSIMLAPEEAEDWGE
jgi:alpha-aminoadipate carrier protein LysW